MHYQAINALLFALYMVGCGAAFMLSRDNKRNSEQTAVYAITIFVFYVIAHLPPEVQAPSYRMGPSWYLVNASVDFFILVYAWRVKAQSSAWILRLACTLVALDILYFGFAYAGYKLPGVWFFVISSTCQSLQVLVLIVFSGPVVPALRKTSHRIAGVARWLLNWPNKHERVVGHT